MGTHLSIDETSLSNDELHTIVINKATKGRKDALVAIIKRTKAADIIEVLRKTPDQKRRRFRMSSSIWPPT